MSTQRGTIRPSAYGDANGGGAPAVLRGDVLNRLYPTELAMQRLRTEQASGGRITLDGQGNIIPPRGGRA